MSILFSPLGESDPIRGDFDGPMLHILRNYTDIDTCYLITTKTLEEANNYEKCTKAIDNLAKTQGREITSYQIRTGIVDVNNFDRFYKLFLEEINKIIEKFSNETIYLNLSSGTPQMMTSLALISCMSLIGNLKAIQVFIPNEKSKYGNLPTTHKDYDVDMAIENNLDNLENASRCLEPELMSVYYNNTKALAKAFLEKFDYEAAYSIYNNPSFSKKEILELIQHLKYRQQLDVEAAKKVVANNSYSSKLFLKYLSTDKKDERRNKVLEYYLILNNLLRLDNKSGSINDFIIRLPSYVLEVQKELIFKVANYNVLTKFCGKIKDKFYLDMKKIEKYSKDLYNNLENKFNGFKDTYINLESLNVIINYELNKMNVEDKDSIIDVFNKVEELKKYRNISAHELKIVKLADLKNDEDVKIDVNNLMSQLQKILKYIYPDVSDNYFKLYKDLNTYILKQL